MENWRDVILSAYYFTFQWPQVIHLSHFLWNKGNEKSPNHIPIIVKSHWIPPWLSNQIYTACPHRIAHSRILLIAICRRASGAIAIFMRNWLRLGELTICSINLILSEFYLKVETFLVSSVCIFSVLTMLKFRMWHVISLLKVVHSSWRYSIVTVSRT